MFLGMFSFVNYLYAKFSFVKAKLVIAFLLFFGVINFSRGESIRFRSFTIEDGLPNNTINSITSDSLGFIWLSTSNGLARFDGYSFCSYTSSFPYGGGINKIQYFNNQIWSCNQSQIIAFGSQNHQWQGKVNSPISGEISSVVSCGDSILYFVAGANLCRYDQGSGATSFRTFAGELKSAEVTPNQKLVVASSDSLYLLDLVNLCLLQKVKLPGIQIIHKTLRGTLLVGTHNSLLEVSSDLTRSGKVLLKNYDISAISESDNFYWIGTEDQGLVRISKEDNRFEVFNTTTLAQLNDDHITSLHLDKNSQLWIGTRYGGLHLLIPRSNTFLHYHPGNLQRLTSSQITGFLADRGGTIFLMTPERLFSWDPSNSFVSPIKGHVSENLIFKAFFQSGDKFYLGTNKGIWIINAQRQLIPVDNTRNLDINAFYQRRNGIWVIATNENEFIQADTLFNIRSRIVPGKMRSEDLPPNRITSIIETVKGKIYLGTENGLVAFNESTLSFKVFRHSPKRGLLTNLITCLYEDHQGGLWVGTENGGLSLFHPEQENFENFGDTQGFIGKSVFSINEDIYGLLWLGTDKGLSRFDPMKRRFTQFTTADGVQDNRFLPASTIKLRTGELLFGGINGFNRFHSSQFRINSRYSPVVFTSVEINNQSYSENDSLVELKYDQNDIYVEFSLLNYTQSEKNTYAVCMESLDDSWVNIGGRHSLSYNNLAAGEYTLKVKGWSYDGVAGEPAIIHFNILPPWWKTPLAYSVYIILFILIVWLTIRFFLQRIRLRNQLHIEKIKRQQSEEMINFKLKFYTNVSHEIRTPLTLISGPLQKLSEGIDENSSSGQQIRIMKQNTSRLLRLVEQLLDFRRLQSDKLPFRPVNHDMVAFIKDVISAFEGGALAKSVTITSQLPDHKVVVGFDPDKMEKILFNLLSNAIKFAPQNGEVNMVLASDDEKLTIAVIDNGPGISFERQEQIFDRFETEGGIGIGLALTRELVKMHGGTLQYQPNPEGGSCFIVELPVARYQEVSTSNSHSTIDLDSSVVLKERFTLLIVEDDDELRTYIAGIFKDSCNVFTAGNGKLALESIEKNNPHLIISDVMMPEMDGITLCCKIKSDINHCHIPVVLLTAYADIQHQLEGAEAGADLYIPKPFNNALLRSNVFSILGNRQKIKTKFAGVASVDTSSIAPSKLDKSLVNRITELIDANLDNPDLSVELLSSEIGLSRSQLTRKLNSLAGLAPGQFIQNYKLKKAAHLLKTTHLNVSEVAYQTGFSDPKYFSRNFKKLFGVTPIEYRK